MANEIKTKIPIDEPANCSHCAKNDVCLIARTLKGLGEQFKDADGKAKPPFDPLRFALVCEGFLPPFAKLRPLSEMVTR